MKKLVGKFGRYNVAAFIIMAVGVILFLLTPLLLWLFNFDSDIFGFFIFIIGLLMYVVGLVVRLITKKARSNKMS
jgi:uncharacterized membrane protein